MWQLLAAVALAAGGAAAAKLLPSVSSERNDYNLSYDRAERILVFARSDADFANARIYMSEKRRGRWSEPEPISFTDPRWSDSDPWLTPDGRTLYFVSTRPTVSRPDKKDLDLWRSRRLPDGSWSAPEHLGDALSSPNPELGPELHSGRLYFSSVRRGGKGGLDIYVARIFPSGNFEAPVPLPGPFNSAASESDFTLSMGGWTALFWRTVGDRGLIHISRRDRDGAWSEPEPLPDRVNVGPFNFTPALANDDRTLRFASTRERDGQERGLADVYVVKLPKPPN